MKPTGSFILLIIVIIAFLGFTVLIGYLFCDNDPPILPDPELPEEIIHDGPVAPDSVWITQDGIRIGVVVNDSLLITEAGFYDIQWNQEDFMLNLIEPDTVLIQLPEIHITPSGSIQGSTLVIDSEIEPTWIYEADSAIVSIPNSEFGDWVDSVATYENNDTLYFYDENGNMGKFTWDTSPDWDSILHMETSPSRTYMSQKTFSGEYHSAIVRAQAACPVDSFTHTLHIRWNDYWQNEMLPYAEAEIRHAKFTGRWQGMIAGAILTGGLAWLVK
jgi:hypothetical protein